MSFILRNIVGGEERVIYIARLHWIYLVWGVFWLVGLCTLGLYLNHLLWSYLRYAPPPEAFEPVYIPALLKYYWLFAVFAAAGITIFIFHVLKFTHTEIALTDQRIIYKTGWIFIETEESELGEIRAEHVNHGLLGRFLGYGALHLDSRFVGDVYLPAIRRPYNFLRAVHRARKKIHDPIERG